MSDAYLDDDDDDDDEPGGRTVTLRRDQIRQLEKQAKAATEATARADAAERKLAFAEAGLSLADPKMAYFVKGYDGEMTAAAITEAATTAGFLGAETPPATPDVPDAEAEALARNVDVSAYGGAPPAGAEAVVDRLVNGRLSEAEFWREASGAGLT